MSRLISASITRYRLSGQPQRGAEQPPFSCAAIVCVQRQVSKASMHPGVPGRSFGQTYEGKRVRFKKAAVSMSEVKANPVKAVYDLREAAVEHGIAVAHLETEQTPETRDEVLDTQLALEEKTIAAIDECSDNAEDAVATAKRGER